MSTRLAVLGGSSAFLPALAEQLARRARDLPALEVRLQGRDRERVESVARFSNLVARRHGAAHAYHATLDVAEAAAGAAVIVNQMRVGGFAGREHDELFPLAFDLPGDETIGPGGLASALRATPVILAAARTCERVAPGAWFVNLSNPMNVLLGGLRQVAGLRSLGLCELPGETLARALALIGLSPGEVEADYVGINHQGWFVRVRQRGREILPELIEAVAALETDTFFRVEGARLRELGALPLPYLRLYYHREREVRAQRARARSRGRELGELSQGLFAHYASDTSGVLPAELARRSMPWIDDAVLPALLALLGGPACELYVSEENRGHLAWLPDAALVEKRCAVDARGARALALSPDVRSGAGVPASCRELLGQLVEFERRALAAALAPSAERVAAALRAHPFGLPTTAPSPTTMTATTTTAAALVAAVLDPALAP